MNFRLYLFCLAAALFTGSCKKKENAAPVITITSPASGELFVPGDSIHIEADLTDDAGLTTVTLKLLNAAYMPVDHQESFNINSPSYHLTYDYLIENNYLESGNYFIALSTSDGANDFNEFRTIVIQEIPKTTKAVYILTAPDSSHFDVHKLDSANQLALQFSVQGDYSGSAVNSRHSVLSTVGKVSGAINLFSLPANGNFFSVPPYNSTLPSFHGLYPAHNLTFVSFHNGEIKAFDKDGAALFNSQQPVSYIPGALCVNDEYVFTESYYPGSGENRLTVLYYPLGTVRQEYNIGLDIVSMIPRSENEIIIFGNSNGDGKVLLYNVLFNGANKFHTLFGNTLTAAVAIDDDRYAIASEQGLYSYQESSNNLVPVDLDEPVHSLEYNDVSGILFVTAEKKIKSYAFPDGTVLNTITLADSVLDVRVQYNK